MFILKEEATKKKKRKKMISITLTDDMSLTLSFEYKHICFKLRRERLVRRGESSGGVKKFIYMFSFLFIND